MAHPSLDNKCLSIMHSRRHMTTPVPCCMCHGIQIQIQKKSISQSQDLPTTLSGQITVNPLPPLWNLTHNNMDPQLVNPSQPYYFPSSSSGYPEKDQNFPETSKNPSTTTSLCLTTTLCHLAVVTLPIDPPQHQHLRNPP